MNPGSLGTLTLRTRLRVAAFGWTRIAVLILCLASAATWWVVIPRARATLAQTQAMLGSAQAALASASASDTAQARPAASINLEKFHDALGESHYAEQQIKTLLALAGRSGLTLSRAEYKYGHDRHAAFDTVSITLPVSGSYAAIRQFCVATLLAIPFAALDDVSFKRTAIAADRVEASLRFTLYLAAPGARITGAQP